MMKNLLFLAGNAILLACAAPINSNNGPEILNAKYVRLIQDTMKMMLIQDVVIEYGDLIAEADSALYDKPKKTITAYSVHKASFKGVNLAPSVYKDSLRYTKGAAFISGNSR